MHNATPNAAAPTHTTQDQVIEQFQTLVRDTEALLAQSANLVGEQAEELRLQIRESLERARVSLHSAEENVRERGQAALEATETYVQTHPWQAVGIAAGVGVLLGMLIRR